VESLENNRHSADSGHRARMQFPAVLRPLEEIVANGEIAKRTSRWFCKKANHF
jgi:hypothetical protein